MQNIYKTINQIAIIDIFLFDIETTNSTPGVEYTSKYDLHEMFNRHAYHTMRFLYHAKNVYEELTTNIPGFGPTNEPFRTRLTNGDRIYYEFDAFISTASSIFEEPFKKDAEKFFSKKQKKEFIKIFPTKQSENSLKWRLTIMRNRIVHPDHPTFTHNNDRFLEFSSKRGDGSATIDNGEITKIPTHLIDIEYNPELKNLLKEQIEATKIIKKAFKKHKKKCTFHCSPILPNFHEHLFSHGKDDNSGDLVLCTISANLVQSFYSILGQLIDYTQKVHQLYLDEIKNMMEKTSLEISFDHYCILNNEGQFIGKIAKKPEASKIYIKISDLFNVPNKIANIEN